MSDSHRPPTIVAMGGGGFMMEPDNPLLDDFVLSLADVARPKLCLLPTATGDSERLIAQFHGAFQERPVEARHLRLFGAPRTDLRAFLLSQDVIYVGGGNTANMLAVWRVHGIDRILREAWQAGVVLAGLSAGMICWFEAGVTDSFGPLAPLRDGLGLLPGSACPHFDGEVQRRPAYHMYVRDGFPPGFAADDGAALVFRGAELPESVASRPSARCYRVALHDAEVIEVPITTRYLGV
jgi:dipeptidase E